MRVTVTRIEWDGTMQRRVVDTAQRDDGPQWEDLATRACLRLIFWTDEIGAVMAEGVVAGIDWASEIHVACVLDRDGG